MSHYLSVLRGVTVNGGGDLPAGPFSRRFIRYSRRHTASAGAPGPEKVAISCTSGFAIQWLLPRLADFERRYPQIEILIGTTNRRVDLLSEGDRFCRVGMVSGAGRNCRLIACWMTI